MRLSLLQVLQAFVPKELRDDFVQINRSTALHASTIKSIKENSVATEHGEFETTPVFLSTLIKSNRRTSLPVERKSE